MDRSSVGGPSGAVENLPRKPVCPDLEGKAAATIPLRSDLYPAVTRALALIQDNEGGPLPISPGSPSIPVRWQPYLPIIEAAIAELADDRPALEDDDARQIIDSEGWHPRFSEFHSFCVGSRTSIAAIAARTPELMIADNFLADFFECWRLYERE